MKSKCKAFKAIGYTNDKEQVFMTLEGEAPDGRPMEFTIVWNPKDATEVAKLIMQAAHECLQRSPLIVLPGAK
jgi:hypothetical protein